MLSAFLDDPFPWLPLLGRSHILLLHLPLGLVPAIALLEFGAMLFRRPTPRGAILTLAWLCAVAAGLATASGLVLSGESGYGSDTAGYHKIAGITLAALCLISAIASGFARRTAFRILLLLTVLVMVPTGHLGGTLTHGEDWLTEPFASTKGEGEHNDQGDITTGNDTEPAGQPEKPPVSEYLSVIAPILERTCAKCHNPDKQKGELLLTTPEGIQKGSENGEVIVPGEPDNSELLIRLLLPLDDEDHMPPEDKPQPTADELEKLRAWIAGGAKFE